ncbi:MAG: cation-efflux pump [archaeon]
MNKIRALELSLVAIGSVVLFELVAGTIANSLVILSDAGHAAFDTITTLMLLITVRLAQRPPDENHTYGHEKIESIGGLVAGITLLVIAVSLVYESGSRLAFGGTSPQPELIGFLAIGYTLCVDVFRIGTLRKAKGGGDVTVKANLYHAIGDMGSTTVALAGYFLATKIGIPQADAIGSLILGVFLAYLSVSLTRSSGMELSDSIPNKTLKEVQKRISGVEGVLRYKELKARKVGARYFVDTTAILPEFADLHAAHEMATRIENSITSLLSNATVVVHVEPQTGEPSLRSKIESMTLAADGVRGVHSIELSLAEGIMHIVLHAQVDAELSVEKAHKIAENIERNIQSEVGQDAKITVHLEPFRHEKIEQDSLVERRLEEAVRQLSQKRPGVRTKNVTTYLSGGKKYVNIELTFDKNRSVEEAHRISSEMERELQDKFDNIIATIHAEPETDS